MIVTPPMGDPAGLRAAVEAIARRGALEYGSDVLEMQADAGRPGERVLPGNGLLATGGTAEAAAARVEEAGGAVVECCFVVDLPEVGGRDWRRGGASKPGQVLEWRR